ncbi:putative P-loop containing nucleoside triphosphate hydrolase [Septoria linicola]|nr:putative P-loop containing nucleoside triphosphate hydrolase [Septoria linicola]
MANTKLTVVDLYGVPSSGKTYPKDELRLLLGEDDYTFYDGSGKLLDTEKVAIREAAVTQIVEDCAKSGKIGVVTSHLTFWSQNEAVPNMVFTAADAAVYTHIIYINTPACRIKSSVVMTKSVKTELMIRPTSSRGIDTPN